MNTILSIDLDILFSPYTGIYNNQINNCYNCEKIWNGIEQSYTISDFTPNLEYCEIILNLFQNYSSQINTIYIGQDHSSILTAIELEKNNFQQPYNFNLYNIDYHHDIGYEKQAIEDIKNNRINCGNWVGFLNYYKFLNQYFWLEGLGTHFDQFILTNDLKELLPSNFERKIFDKDFPLDLNIDLLYITFSPPWIPPKYYEIIAIILKELDQNKIKYLPTGYQEGNLKKPFLSLPGEKGYEIFNFLY